MKRRDSGSREFCRGRSISALTPAPTGASHTPQTLSFVPTSAPQLRHTLGRPAYLFLFGWLSDKTPTLPRAAAPRPETPARTLKLKRELPRQGRVWTTTHN
ncbi:MAG TPA: hypothetical protein VNA19_12005 [Pyrinomonadaceae bacterium]|nr:hypothetical protein [Pyrinomonadaceae bacterium]